MRASRTFFDGFSRQEYPRARHLKTTSMSCTAITGLTTVRRRRRLARMAFGKSVCCGSPRGCAKASLPAAHLENCRAMQLAPQRVAHRRDASRRVAPRCVAPTPSRRSCTMESRIVGRRGARVSSGARRARRLIGSTPIATHVLVGERGRRDRRALVRSFSEGGRELEGCNRSLSWEMLRRSIPTENWRGRRFL